MDVSWVRSLLSTKFHDDENVSTKEFEKKYGVYAEWVCGCEVGKSQLERRGKFRLRRVFRTIQLKINCQV